MKGFAVLSLLLIGGFMVLDSWEGRSSDYAPLPTPTPTTPAPAPRVPPPSQAPVPPPDSGSGMTWEQMQEMLRHSVDLFAAYAQWEYGLLSGTMARASHVAQALMGFLLCVRGLLTFLGLYTLLTMRRLLERVGG